MREARPAHAGHHFISLDISGDDLHGLAKEAGGHRIQRVPPNEKRGRVHTSTVTVAIIDPGSANAREATDSRADSDFQIEWFHGTGKGGQHRNKHANCCRLIHLPTGIVQTATGRTRPSNLREAREALIARLDALKSSSIGQAVNERRSGQIGTGMRGDKRRTYRFQDDGVVDHETGKSASCRKIMAGNLHLLW